MSPAKDPLTDPSILPMPGIGGSFGAVNAAAIAGSLAASSRVSSVTPANIAARYAPTADLNPLTLIGHVGAVVASARWTSVRVDRPTVLFPVGQLGGPLYYCPHRPAIGIGGAAAFLLSIEAVGPGVAYLSAPGDWWLNYAAAGAAAPIGTWLMIPCEDPGLASLLLSEPGCQGVNQGAVTVPFGASATIIAANPRRRGLLIQNMLTVQPLQLGLGQTPTAADGIALTGRGTISFTGNQLWRGSVVGFNANASLDTVATYIEFL